MRAPVSSLGRYMRKKGITNEWLADRTGYSISLIRAWRAKRRIPGKPAVKLLASSLGLLERTVISWWADKEQES